MLHILVIFMALAQPGTRPASGGGYAKGDTTTRSSQPSDDVTVDWLMGQATTAPSTQPTTDQVVSSPLVSKDVQVEGRRGTITLSDGTALTGIITTTAERPLRFWDESAKDYRDVPLKLIKTLVAEVVWEREEPEYGFKESGSDVKVLTGKTYPARETQYVATLINGQSFTGGVVAPLYVTTESSPGQSKTQQLVLNKRNKGEAGQSLKQLVYVQRVEFGDGGGSENPSPNLRKQKSESNLKPE